MIARRHYPNLFNEKGELDVPEVDNTIRNAWLSIYHLQEQAEKNKLFLEGAVSRGEIAADDDILSTNVVSQATVATVVSSPITGATLVNATVNRLPFINSTLQLDSGPNAPEYNSSTKALTIRGALTIIGASTLTGNVTMAGTLAVTGAVTLTVPLAVPQGGTGAATFTDGGLMLGSGTGILTVLGRGTAGQMLIGSTSGDPVMGTITGTANEITVTTGDGTLVLSIPDAVTLVTLTLTNDLIVANGGTGAGTFTDGGVLLGSGTGALTVLGQATNGQLVIGSTGVDPVLAALTGTANEITVTNGAGAITLSIPNAVALEAVSVLTSIALSNATEGGTANIKRLTATETHTLDTATTSVTSMSIPAGARLLGASFNVNTAVTNDGDDTWLAAFSGGSTTNVAPASSGASQNTKVDTQIADEIATATTEITFTPQSGSFTAGVIEIVVYYETLTSLANV